MTRIARGHLLDLVTSFLSLIGKLVQSTCLVGVGRVNGNLKKDASSLPNNKVNLLAMELEPLHCTVTIQFSCLGTDSKPDHRRTPVCQPTWKGAGMQETSLQVQRAQSAQLASCEELGLHVLLQLPLLPLLPLLREGDLADLASPLLSVLQQPLGKCCLRGTFWILFMAPWQEEALFYLLKRKHGVG